MFWDSGHDYEREFSNRVRELVWKGDRAGIKQLYQHLGALEMLNHGSPEVARANMRSNLRNALLEPNRSVRRGIIKRRLFVR